MIKVSPLWLAALCLASSAQGEIAGSYATRCTKTNSGSEIRSVQFSTSQLRDSQTVYDDRVCGKSNFDIAFQGPYTLDQETGALDFEIRMVTIRPHSREIAAYFNSARLCGLRDWSSKIARNVTGLTCGSTDVPPAGSVIYNIVRELQAVGAEGEESSMIQFGYSDSEHDGSSPLTRPVTFDSQILYQL